MRKQRVSKSNWQQRACVLTVLSSAQLIAVPTTIHLEGEGARVNPHNCQVRTCTLIYINKNRIIFLV